MKENLLKSMQYEEWANAIVLQSLRQSTDIGERLPQLFAHILAPQSIWLSRIRHEVPLVGLWPELTLDECAQMMAENLKQWRAFINAAAPEDFYKSVAFKLPNSDKERSMAVYEVVAHLTNHGTYHRGQIILGLKGKTERLPLTTYIAFLASLD